MKRWLGWPSVVAAIMAAGIVTTLVVLRLASDLSPRRDYLRSEIARLDQEIEEVSSIHYEIAEFLARKQIIETLERDRSLGLRLLNEVTRQRPDGVRFVSVTFASERITVEGVAASEVALRKFTAAVAASSVLQAPEGLVTRGSDFSFQSALRAREQ